MRRRAAGLLAALVVAGPVLIGIGYAAREATAPGPGTLGRILTDPAVRDSVLFSAWIATAATAIATVLAVAVAVLFRPGGAGSATAQALAAVVLPIPHVVAAAVGVLILGQSGLLARIGHALGTVPLPSDMPPLVLDRWGIGLILTLAWKEFAFLALVAFSVLAARARDLEEAARTLGAGPVATLGRVTLPVLWRGMLPAIVAVYTFALGSYETAALLAPSDPLALPLLTLERYADSSAADRAEAFALVLVALLLGALAVVAHEWARGRWGEVAE